MTPTLTSRRLLLRPWSRGGALGLGDPGVDEVFAVIRPNNTRGAATAERIGMECVGETDKYYELQLQVYRLRAGDLDQPLAAQQHGADQHLSSR